jgi:hypothetical protein
MRIFEREPGETPKAWDAFKIYRDLGKGRTHKKVAELMGKTPGYCRTLEIWSSKNDWIDRAQAWDDYHEMMRNEGAAEYVRAQGSDLATREAQVQEKILGLKEKIIPKLEAMTQFPIERRTVEQDGRTVHIHPARWSFHTLIRALEVMDDTPDKIAFTDPTGQKEYGQTPDDIRRMFAELVEKTDGDPGPGD